MKRNYKTFNLTDEWESDDPAIQEQLDFLRIRKTGSVASRDNSLSVIDNFCYSYNTRPQNVVLLPKAELQEMIQSWADEKVKNGLKKSAANLYLRCLKTFARENGFNAEEKGSLKLNCFREPSRYEVDEYIPTLEEAHKMANMAGSLRNSLAICLCTFSGLMNSDARALRYGDFMSELKQGRRILTIRIKLYLKQRVANACKGGIEYFSFVPEFVTNILELLIEEQNQHFKKKELPPLGDDDFVLMTNDRKISLEKRRKTPMTSRELLWIVKQAARRAGIKDWKRVRAHTLPKVFQNILTSPLSDRTNLHEREVKFLMGHKLAGPEDTYFDKRPEKFLERFAKLNFGGMQPLEDKFMQWSAEMFGIDIERVVKEEEERLGGRNLSAEERKLLMRNVLKQQKTETPSYEQKLIKSSELQDYMNDGWEFQASPEQGSAIVRKPKSDISSIAEISNPSPKNSRDDDSEHQNISATKNRVDQSIPEKSAEDFSEHKATELKHDDNTDAKYGNLDDFL